VVKEMHLQARWRVPFQNSSGIRATNQPWVFRGNKLVPSSSVYIREIRGFHSVAQACLGGDLQKMPHHSRSESTMSFQGNKQVRPHLTRARPGTRLC
jgi:hypothetical protein